MTVDQVAEIVHEANKTYCEQQGDHSQVHWTLAPKNIQQSAIEGVRYKILNPDATPEQQHQAWCDFKTSDGWVFGEKKDAEKKEHDCLVPYDQLPEFQQIKDYLFTGIVKSLLKFVK